MPMPDENVEVLLVDDDPDAQKMLRAGLEDAGIQVRSARNGEEALTLLGASKPDAVLLDVMMPGIDGFATCTRIRETEENLPVIFMTGLGETEHIVRGFAVGGTDYVTKPVSIPVVVARIQSHTRVSRLVRSTREVLDAMETAMLAHDTSGTLLWYNTAARRLFRSLGCEEEPNEGMHLPDAMIRPASPETPCIVAYGTGEVEIRRVTEDDKGIVICTLRSTHTNQAPEWKPPKITDRESEVLLWVARGKTNRDIGEILGMSPRTVNKHLEHIFEKLGVETRTAAAAAAQRLNMQKN